MFNIRYKILEDEDIEPYELKGEYGYFEFQTNDEIYGIYIDEILDIFSVSVYWWFYYFLNSLLLLNVVKEDTKNTIKRNTKKSIIKEVYKLEYKKIVLGKSEKDAAKDVPG